MTLPDSIAHLDEFHQICYGLARRSPDLKEKHGAAVVGRDFIIGTGYNHPVYGYECAQCPRYLKQIPSGALQEQCYAIHAEQAAVLDAMRAHDLRRAHLPVTVYDLGLRPDYTPILLERPEFRCTLCSRIMAEAGVTEVAVATVVGTVKLSIAEALKSSFEMAVKVGEGLLNGR